MQCDRCDNRNSSFIMSFFNTDTICESCERREKAHPHYDEARRVEHQHVVAGDYNFKGIGRPTDL